MSNLVAATSRTSFVQSVIQHALDHGLVTTDWVETFSVEAQRVADGIAERETRERAPTEQDFRGAGVRLQQYLTFALDRAAWGNIDQAARILVSTPLRDLMRNGKLEFQQTRQILRRHVRNLDLQSGRLFYTNTFPLQTIGWWLESSIDDLGRTSMTGPEVESVFGWLVFYKHEAELGRVLDNQLAHTSRYLPLSYSQLVGNLAVNLVVHSQADGSVTLANIKRFMQHIVRKGQPDQAVIDQVGVRLAQTVVEFGASPMLASWLQKMAWPLYADAIIHTSQFRLTRLLCLDHKTFFPVVTKTSKVETTSPDLSAERRAFERFTVSPVRQQLQMLEALPDTDSRDSWLIKLHNHVGPSLTVELFARLPARQICQSLRLHKVQRRDFDRADDSLPAWIVVYLEQLKRQPKTRQRIITQFLKTRRETRLRGEQKPKSKR